MAATNSGTMPATMASPRRAESTALVRAIPRERLGRFLGFFGIWEIGFVREWLGGRWEQWLATEAPGQPTICWLRVTTWSDMSTAYDVRIDGQIYSVVSIRREEWM